MLYMFRVTTSVCVIFAATMWLVLLSPSPATALTVDVKLGEELLGNSGDAAEAQALADILGVDVNTLTLVEKNEAPVAVFDSGNWVIDVNPDEPSYFVLKFGIGGINPAPAANILFSKYRRAYQACIHRCAGAGNNRGM